MDRRTVYVALLRGVNVGRAKRISMADLRASVEALGYSEVRTVLNSGNVIFSAATTVLNAEAAIADAITRHGITARVFVVPLATIRVILATNPLASIATDPSRLLIAMFAGGTIPDGVIELAARSWGEDRFDTANNAAFLWCAEGVLQSPLAKAFHRAAGDAATARNWATMMKLGA